MWCKWRCFNGLNPSSISVHPYPTQSCLLADQSSASSTACARVPRVSLTVAAPASTASPLWRWSMEQPSSRRAAWGMTRRAEPPVPRRRRWPVLSRAARAICVTWMSPWKLQGKVTCPLCARFLSINSSSGNLQLPQRRCHQSLCAYSIFRCIFDQSSSFPISIFQQKHFVFVSHSNDILR